MPNKTSGLTIIEVLFSTLLIALLMSGFFYALSTGELSNTFSSAKADLQAEVRRTIDWVMKDARQTVSWDITNNNPSNAYIKFRQAQGWDTTNNVLLLNSDFIEYVYDANAKTITRRSLDAGGNIIQAWTFNNIISPPFYTINSGGAVVALNSTDLLTSRRLVLVISAQKQVKGALNTSCSLTGEIKIRNE